MSHVGENQDASRRNEYGTKARVQMDDRTLLLRGGVYDGRTWVGVVSVGQRVFCGGDEPWSMAGMYVVTDLLDETGEVPVNIAVPVFAS